MNRCDNCNVFVYESETLCPLCQAQMQPIGETFVEFPEYKKISNKFSPINNIPHFITAASIIICVYINIFTYDKGDIIWSIIVSCAVICSFALYMIIKTNKKRYGSKVVYTYMLISSLVVVIDYSTGMRFWSTDFVFPFLTLSVLLYLTILAIRNKGHFSEYFGYLLTVTAISFTSIPLFIFGLYNYGWGALISILSCVIIAIGLYLFVDKPLKSEIKKRFNS